MNTSVTPQTRRVDIMALAILIVLASLVAYLSVSSSLGRIKALTAEQETLTSRLSYLTELAQVLGQGEKTLELLQTGIAELDRRLPAAVGFPAFYGTLTECAVGQNVLLAEIQPGSVTDEEDYLRMAVGLRGKTTFENLHAFLFALGNLERLTKVERLSVEPSEEPYLCDIDMTVNIYAASRKESDNGR